MTELLLDFPVERTGEHPVAGKGHQSMRQAFAAAFEGAPRPDPRHARVAFDKGMALIRELEEKREISKKAAASLTGYMAALYVSVLISRLSDDLGGAPPPIPLPDFLKRLFRGPK